MRCCVRDEGWPFGTALRREVPNHRVLRWLKTVVVSDTEKAHGMRQVGIRKTVRSLDGEIAVDVSLLDLGDIKTGANQECPGRSPAGGRLLAGRCPACRRREPDLLLSHGTWEGMARYCCPGW